MNDVIGYGMAIENAMKWRKIDNWRKIDKWRTIHN